ncbi:MAG: NYN domain-containing protein [Methermicoccaceae archaeon]
MAEVKEEKGDRKLAVLVDGDNAQHSRLGSVLEEVLKYGRATIRRVYGDWTNGSMSSWSRELLIENSIECAHQFNYTTGKNATDISMIIDAMDILHEGDVDGIVIVSSDSDYTRLAMRFRQAGKFVMGVGERKTPRAFVNACETFVYTENLQPKPDSEEETTEEGSGSATSTEEELLSAEQDKNPLPLLKKAFAMVEQDDGWAHLAAVGIALHKLDPAFDSRTYGYPKLIKLIRAHSDVFELKWEQEKGPSAIYVKKI